MATNNQIARKRRLPITNALAGAVLVALCAASIGLGLYREAQIRSAEIRTAEGEASNLARSLLQHAEDSIELADTALIGIAQRLETDGFGAEAVARLQAILDLRKATLPRIRGLFVYAADGSWVATTERVNIHGHNNSDRDYFKYHQSTTERSVLVGPPIRSRSSDQWIITVSRRVNTADGSFAGVVLATLDVDTFVRSFSRFDVGAQGSLALLTPAGTMIARYPDDDAAVGRNFAGSPFMRHVRAENFGVVHFRSVLDGVDRISAYYRSERFPLLMLVARGREDVLAGWRLDAQWRMSIVVGLTLLIAGLGVLMLRELAARQRLVRVISSHEADFRLLAETSSDMVTRIAFDGRLTYVSPSSLRIVGWSPEELIGGHSLTGAHSDDRPAVEMIVQEMRAGKRLEALVAYRTRHKTSGTVWLESSLSVTRDPATGKIDGVVAVSRDVTEHKEREGHLSRLATLDSLTGLANRRVLDSLATREFGLARKNRAPLSLLLLDADNFKAFNDLYGHQAGDHCLQQIATVIKSHATRPGDVAARFGGEEFALLLPDTDESGAAIVAERIRQAVQELGIPHLSNGNAGVVTVSIGGASVSFDVDGLTLGDLVRCADVSLYAAKAASRNCVRTSTCSSVFDSPPTQPALAAPRLDQHVLDGWAK